MASLSPSKQPPFIDQPDSFDIFRDVRLGRSLASLMTYYLPMLIPVFSPQDSYLNHPNNCHLWKLPQNLLLAPWSLRCELPFYLDGSFSDLTSITVYCSYGPDYSLSLSTLDSLCVLNGFPLDGYGSRYGTDGPPPVPGLPGCYLTDGSTIIFFDFIMLLLFELGRFSHTREPGTHDANDFGTVIVILTLWRCFKSCK